MAEHENCIGESDDWYTPPAIFDALRLQFDLDPCSPGPAHWVPAARVYTEADDGLSKPWSGTVFMNPPFGGRNGHVPWLVKFFDHGNGVAIVRSYTSSGWWHDHMHRAEALLWPRGKTKFVRPDGSIGRAPGHGIVLVGMGERCCRALEQSGLGMYWDRRRIGAAELEAAIRTITYFPEQRRGAEQPPALYRPRPEGADPSGCAFAQGIGPPHAPLALPLVRTILVMEG